MDINSSHSEPTVTLTAGREHELKPPSQPPPPPSSPGPGASRGPGAPSPTPAGAAVSSSSLADDLRSVQASLDRFQGQPGPKNSDGVEGPVGVTYNAERVLGSGAFGIVYQARVMETDEIVAIKKVLQDARFKNRELEMMQELKHPNVVELKSAFHVPGEKPRENYLNVVMEYCRETMQNLMSHYAKSRRTFPYELVQIYTYHMLRGVAYVNAKNICHRDIKPPNLLINEATHELKICDFGSAKRLSKGEPNVAYICSRYYRAPELIFGATEYSTLIDMWSVACVTAEMILQQVLFPGDSGVDQLMEIIKVLGTPTMDDLNSMNPVYGEFKFPQIKSYPWSKIFRSRTSPEAVDWLSKILQYDPKKRPNGLQACMHKMFHDLRSPHFKTATPLSMFWFSDEELALMNEEMRKALIPEWARHIEQGGEVPRKLGLAKRPECSGGLSTSLPSSSRPSFSEGRTSAASPLPAEKDKEKDKGKEKRPRRRDKDKEGENAALVEKAVEPLSPLSDESIAADSTRQVQASADPAGADPRHSSKDADARSDRRERRESEKEKRRRSPRPKHKDGEDRERSGKAADGHGQDEAGSVSSSSRREKRKGREREKTRENLTLVTPNPDEVPDPSRSLDLETAAMPPGAPGSISAREPAVSSIAVPLPEGPQSARVSGPETRRSSGEGDPLADFSHALRTASKSSVAAAVPAESKTDMRSKQGGLSGKLPLASAGAMQLVPAAAASQSLR